MNSDVTIREARTEDCARILELNRDALGYDYPFAKTQANLAGLMTRPSNKILVGEYKGEVAGYIHAADYDCTYNDPMKNIMALAVDEKLRGMGIGRLLLCAAEKWAAECGCKGVRLASGFARTQAHEFYRHCGYTLRKEHKNFVKLF